MKVYSRLPFLAVSRESCLRAGEGDILQRNPMLVGVGLKHGPVCKSVMSTAVRLAKGNHIIA
ncbi:hypothetical protein HQ563_03405 [bacterium]|nr:hypothetical protein [bacterium]